MLASMWRTDRPLRTWVEEILVNRNTHATLGDACGRYGLPAPEAEGSKRDRARSAMKGLADRQVAAAAEKLAIEASDVALHEAALTVLEGGEPPITEITRVDVARCFDELYLSGEQEILPFLRKLWPVDTIGDPFTGIVPDIERNLIRNVNWTVEDLFEKLGALDCSRWRFVATIEAALDPRARRGEVQEKLRACIDEKLSRDGYKVVETDRISGHPVYRIVRAAGGVAGAPKNLIFASAGPKPEIGFADAINNDIVIFTNRDSCLVYDRPIPDDGLAWERVVEWWRETYSPAGTSEADARKALGRRLQQSLDSEGERNLFSHYFKEFRPRLRAALPALVPQVYLHYDPATIAQLRAGKRLERQRMDFLLLLPNKNRVVLEVDGKHHFSEGDAPSLRKYADMTRADRQLRLLGYEVYRFGANELVGDGAAAVVASFFDALFKKHGVRA